MSIAYSDGREIESQVYRLLREAKDLDSLTPIALSRYADWPVRYHLCPERGNLVRPLNFSGLKVLELGAGMGAVSRVLSETAESLYVVEGTQVRFNALSERLRDRTNWKGEVANIADFKTSEKFDVVCVVGVLEYSELYIDPGSSKSPFHRFLEMAKSFLKEDGALVLAIENKMGLKYWSGAGEDHTSRLFDGVCGYPFKKSPRTFSRKELKDRLRDTGFPAIEEYFPFPDYKIPSSILNLALLEENATLAADIASLKPFEQYGVERPTLYSETLALNSVAKAGLLADFSNSLLFVAAPSKDSDTFRRLNAKRWLGEVGWHYAVNRATPTVTVFQQTPDGLFSKKQGVRQVPMEGAVATWSQEISPIVPGLKVRQALLRESYFEGTPRALKSFVHFLKKGISYWQEDDGFLKKEALDALYTNAVISEDSYRWFDLEWRAKEPVGATWWILRNCLALRTETAFWVEGCPSYTVKSLYEDLCRELGYVADYASDTAKEARFQEEVTPRREPLHYEKAFWELASTVIPSVSYFHDAPALAQMQRQSPFFFHPVTWFFFRVGRKLSTYWDRYPLARKSIKGALWGARYTQKQFAKAKALRGGRVLPKMGWSYLSAETPDPVSVLRTRVKLRGIECEADLTKRGSRWVGFLKISQEAESLHFVDEQGKLVEGVTWRLRPLSRLEAAVRLLVPVTLSAIKTDRKGWRKDLQAAWKRGGVPAVKAHWQQEALKGPIARLEAYSTWIKEFDSPTSEDLNEMKARAREFTVFPLISVVMPVYNPDPTFLTKAIESVLAQVYPNWELCVADDRSTDPKVKEVLEAFRSKDPRVRVTYRETNGHIVEASNTALQLASGEFVAFLDHDDELAPWALYAMVERLNANPQLDFLFSDEDKIDLKGQRFDPHFKSELNRELLYGYNQITHLAMVRHRYLRELGGFRKGFEGAQDYDLFLRLIEKLPKEKIAHVPQVLYHWRTGALSTASSAGTKSYAYSAAERAIADHLDRRGTPGKVVALGTDGFRVEYADPAVWPKASLLIGTKDRVDLLKPLVEGVLHSTEYPDYEILILNNQTTDPETLAYLKSVVSDLRVRVVDYPHPFNFSAMNNAGAKEAKGDILVFLNNDLKIIHPEWLKEMVRRADLPGAGAVGAKLYYPDERVQHAGIVLGLGQMPGYRNGVAGHGHRRFYRGESGYQGRLKFAQGISAVTAACLAVKKSVFESVGGFDEEHLAIAFNDVDLCLKIRKAGYENVFTPFAELYHLESVSRGSDLTEKNAPRFYRECQFMLQKWGKELENDPYYSPNLTLDWEDFTLAFPPRVPRVWE